MLLNRAFIIGDYKTYGGGKSVSEPVKDRPDDPKLW